MNIQAFTFKADNLLNCIITPIGMRQSLELCREYKLMCQQAQVRALWDTGATGSCISKGLAKHLNLKPIDMCTVRGVSGPAESYVYYIDLLLPSNVEILNVRVSEFLDNGTFEIIVGMDIITIGDFAISNKDGKSTVSFRTPPADEYIDFVKQLTESKSGNPTPPPPKK